LKTEIKMFQGWLCILSLYKSSASFSMYVFFSNLFSHRSGMALTPW